MRIILAICLLFVCGCASETKTAANADSKGEHTKKGAEAAVTADKKAAHHDGDGALTCKKGSDTRTIAIREPAGGGCEVAYTVHGTEKVIAHAKSDHSYCKKVADKVKGNLATDKYSCE